MKGMLFGLLLVFGVGNAAQEPDVAATPAAQHLPPSKPVELQLKHAGSKKFDLRKLPQTKPKKQERPEFEEPEPNPVELPGGPQQNAPLPVPGPSAPAPAPTLNFDGLDFATWGAGHPPDTNGDVGPTYYIQTINTSIGVYRKSDQAQVAAFTFNTFMSQGSFGNLCDTNNFGDPVVLYDSFEDRWIITDFAFQLSGGNVVAPAFQCIAASMTGDPVSGGWNFYYRQLSDDLGDYPKFGIWPDGLYMSANLFSFGAGSSFQGARVFAFNKAQMYAGSPTVQVVSFDITSGDFTVIPGNARLQTGTPPAGTPNYFVSTWEFTNALTVYKFHVDWDHISLSTFTGPDTPLAATSWPNAAVPNAPSSGGNNLDVLQIRAMVQNQYSNIGGAESLWVTHTVRRANTTGFAAPRWYQVDVTGGTVAANLPQAATWDPDGANVFYRFMPSVAVDRAGDLAMGYSTSSSTTKPAINYAGRLAGDTANTFSQGEQLLIQGAGTQTGSCGGTCTRWGDYSAMTLDPDGCTFWYTNEYYAVDGLSFLTRIGTFSYPSCTPLGAGGTVSGTVTLTPGGAPLASATVTLGSRSTTTDGSGAYSFTSIPAGTYPGMTASFPGCTPGAASNIVVTDSNTTTQDFALSGAAGSACLTDTTQSDFLAGVSTNLDLNTSPGDITLLNTDFIDQQNTTLGTSGVGITITTFGGQTFTPAVTGKLDSADINLFCSGCTGTTPNLTLSVRATSGGLPTGADLATATITGFSSGAAFFYTGTFASPATLTAGTQYALVIRPTANPSPGTYALTRSGTATAGSDVYAGGTRVAGATSGTVWSIPLTGGVSTDAGFKTHMNVGYQASGDLISSLKDANPASGYTATWTTLSWNATTPTNTSLRFQVAASNSEFGPFNFVGPDTTAATFFTTSGASLSQFNGNRYLQYRAYLATTDGTVTPTLNDVTACYDDTCVPPTTPTVTPGGPTTFCAGGSVTLTSSTASSYQWYFTGNPLGGETNQTYVANASGDYTVVVKNALGCSSAASAITTVTVNPLPATPTITPGGPTTFCAGGSVTLTSSSASGNQWYLNGSPIGGATNQTYVATASGNYTVIVTDANVCSSAASSVTTVTVNAIPATPTITPGGPTTFCSGGSVTLTSSSASGNQWFLNSNPIVGATNSSYVATASGNYTVDVTASSCSSANSSATAVTVNPIPATPTITPSGPTTFFVGGSVTLTSSSASGNQWYLNGNPIGGATNASYLASAAGSYTVRVTSSGCSSATSAATVVTVNPYPTTTALGSSVNPSTSGQSVTFTATVTPNPTPGPGTPTGTVTFYNGAAVLGSPALTSGQATFTTSALAVGSHSIKAIYNGSASFAGSTSNIVTQAVNAVAPILSLSVDDGSLFARYGNVVDYSVTLNNTGNGAATNVNVSSSASAGLDAANTQWSCTNGGTGAICKASDTGVFADTATLPPNRSLTWLVSIPVFANASGPNVTLSVNATGATSASDVDTLVIFRSTLDVANGNGTNSVTPPGAAGVLAGNANQLFTLPPARGNGIEDVFALRAGATQARVQSVTLGTTTLIRLLTAVNGQESVSGWTRARVGSTYAIGSVSGENGQRVILLEGAESSLSAPLGND